MDNTAQSTKDDTAKNPEVAGGGINKEFEQAGPASTEIPGLKEVTKEIELPPEVQRAGVKVRPTTVAIPPKVTSAPSKGGSQATTSQPNITLPLTDDQIAQGLHQSITSSWRWLAEWCRRKIKQFQKALYA